jgi:hypothetical protein
VSVAIRAIPEVHDQIRAKIMPPLVSRSTLQIGTAEALEHLVRSTRSRPRGARR